MKFQRRSLCLIVFFLLAGANAFAQGAKAEKKEQCAEQDYKCQLELRMTAIKSDPKNPENYYSLGLVHSRFGAHKEAIDAYNLYIAIPGVKAEYLADGYNNRGVAYRALKKPDLAYADYTKAMELKPTDASFIVNRANVSVDLKKPDQAIADYDRAIVLNPGYAPAYAQRGLLNSNLSKSDEALKDFGKAIELDPAYGEAYYNRGVVLSARKEYAKALLDYDKYITLVTDPIYLTDAHMNRGIAYYYIGEVPKALAEFSRVIELRPNFANGYRARSMIYREMNKNDLAEVDEKKAAQLSGN